MNKSGCHSMRRASLLVGALFITSIVALPTQAENLGSKTSCGFPYLGITLARLKVESHAEIHKADGQSPLSFKTKQGQTTLQSKFPSPASGYRIFPNFIEMLSFRPISTAQGEIARQIIFANTISFSSATSTPDRKQFILGSGYRTVPLSNAIIGREKVISFSFEDDPSPQVLYHRDPNYPLSSAFFAGGVYFTFTGIISFLGGKWFDGIIYTTAGVISFWYARHLITT